MLDRPKMGGYRIAHGVCSGTVEIRELSVADIPACMKLIADRGWAWTPEQWELMLSLGPGLGAFDGDDLLGTALSTPYPEAQAISGVLVGTWAERRGVGTRLMSNILDMGVPTGVSVLFATPMGEPLYTRLGFHPLGATTAYHGEFRGSATGVTRPATPSDLPAVVALDREVCGFTRENLCAHAFEPSPPWTLRIAEFPAGIGVIGIRERATGLLVGPLIAPTAADACAMIVDVATGLGPVRIDTGDVDVAAFLLAHGFEARTGCTLMVYGADKLRGDRSRYFVPASHAFG